MRTDSPGGRYRNYKSNKFVLDIENINQVNRKRAGNEDTLKTG